MEERIEEFAERIEEFERDSVKSEGQAETLRKTIKRIEEERAEDICRLQAELEDARRESANNVGIIMQKDKEIAKLVEELMARKTTEEQIHEFDAFVRKVELMKENYERRISRLRQAVKDLRKEDNNREPETEEIRFRDIDEKKAPTESEPDKESDWFRVLD